MFELLNLTLNTPVTRSDGTPYRFNSRREAERMARLCWDGFADVIAAPVEEA